MVRRWPRRGAPRTRPCRGRVGRSRDSKCPQQLTAGCPLFGRAADPAEDEENKAPRSAKKRGKQSTGGEPTPRKKARSSQALAKLGYISVEELKSCPAYVRGRLTVDRVNTAVDELQAFFSKEAAFMAKGMSDMSNVELSRYNMLRDLDVPKALQASYANGSPFVLLSDLNKAKHCKQDATGKSIFQVLRHLGRLVETPIQKGDRVFTIPAEGA